MHERHFREILDFGRHRRRPRFDYRPLDSLRFAGSAAGQGSSGLLGGATRAVARVDISDDDDETEGSGWLLGEVLAVNVPTGILLRRRFNCALLTSRGHGMGIETTE
jgi:hypothetical protein